MTLIYPVGLRRALDWELRILHHQEEVRPETFLSALAEASALQDSYGFVLLGSEHLRNISHLEVEHGWWQAFSVRGTDDAREISVHTDCDIAEPPEEARPC